MKVIQKNECWCKDCDKWQDTTTVEFLNVEENAYGEDSFTFVCALCSKKQTSLVRIADFFRD